MSRGYLHVYANVSPRGEMTKSLEKSLRLELALVLRAIQKMGLSFAKPKGSSATGGREQQEGTSPPEFQCKTSLGFCCPVLTVLEQVLRLFMTFMYSSCSADHGQGEFSF